MALATVDAERRMSIAISFGLSPRSTRSIMRSARPREGQRGGPPFLGATTR